ncbi:LuxR family transcriptional regulator [Streptomyces sp. NBC_00094]|uniref:helix-turn-helix transcriptional regulator n=1 Tax=Streptomyces sp. NBC_00094 TaxID=2903620 RepID=UPI002257D3C2|nr:LuxR family transcriptional regulator [Streptomyces sp. NBC_00094]MCX5388741.1 LuxR C-terminal-related transcriptional regulator [Streptomyces sp. NBC_00094]
MLEPFGIDKDTENLYRELLARPGRALSELAESGAAPARLRRQLRVLEDAGLVARTPSRPVRYRPTPPALAIDVLTTHRQQELEKARLAAGAFAELWEEGKAAEPTVQVVQGAEANVQRFLQTQRTARLEVLTLDRPPYVAEGVARQAELQRERMSQGVAYRTLYDRESLAEPHQMELARALADHGEQARVLAGVPLKALIVDGSSALVPVVLSPERHTVVLQPSPLLDGLIALFEALWEKATPLWPRPGSRPGSGERLSDFDRLLLGYAAAGCTDQVIARKTNLNQRTIERHMRRIMDSLDARTRFQAGLKAGLQGHLG